MNRRIISFESVRIPSKYPHAPQDNLVVAVATVDVHPETGVYISNKSDCRWSHETPDTVEAGVLSGLAQSMTFDKADALVWNDDEIIPVLSLRSLTRGVPFGWFEGCDSLVYDLGTPCMTSGVLLLDDVAKCIGLPGVGPLSVEDLYKQGDVQANMAAVARHCLQKAIQIAVLLVRCLFHVGKLNHQGYNDAIRSFAENPDIQKAIEVNWDDIYFPD